MDRTIEEDGNMNTLCEHNNTALWCKECARISYDAYLALELERAKEITEMMKKIENEKTKTPQT